MRIQPVALASLHSGFYFHGLPPFLEADLLSSLAAVRIEAVALARGSGQFGKRKRFFAKLLRLAWRPLRLDFLSGLTAKYANDFAKIAKRAHALTRGVSDKFSPRVSRSDRGTFHFQP
jgi:hypothetical protein